MGNSIHINSGKKINSFLYIHQKEKNIITAAKQNMSINKKLLYRLVHPDYILFDWEYFSRELEFE